MTKAVQKGNKKKVKTNKFIIKCTEPLEDNVIKLADFEEYLTQRIKVQGKTGNLNGKVTVEKNKDSIVVETQLDFSKRYLKYLTKKYIKQQQCREYLRVVATSKNTYELKFLHANTDDVD